jgi:hypothetical protein
VFDVELKLTILNNSLINEQEDIALTLTVEDGGCCGISVDNVDMSDTTHSFNLTYTYAEGMDSIDTTITTNTTYASTASTNTSSLSKFEIVQQNIFLHNSTQVIMESLESSNRELLSNVAILQVSKGFYAETTIGLLISCPETMCIDGKFVLPFSSAIESDISFIAENFNESLASYGKNIKLAGTTSDVLKAFNHIEYDGFLKNHTDISVTLYADSTFDDNMKICTQYVTFIYADGVARSAYYLNNNLIGRTISLTSAEKANSLNGLHLFGLDSSTSVTEEVLQGVLHSSKVGEFALTADEGANTSSSIRSLVESTLSRSYKMNITIPQKQGDDHYRLDIYADYAREVQRIELFTHNGKSPINGDITITFTQYGVAETAMLSANTSSLESIRLALVQVLEGFSNIGPVEVTTEGRTSTDYKTLFGTFYVKFLSNITETF